MNTTLILALGGWTIFMTGYASYTNYCKKNKTKKKKLVRRCNVKAERLKVKRYQNAVNNANKNLF